MCQVGAVLTRITRVAVAGALRVAGKIAAAAATGLDGAGSLTSTSSTGASAASPSTGASACSCPASGVSCLSAGCPPTAGLGAGLSQPIRHTSSQIEQYDPGCQFRIMTPLSLT